MTPKVVADETPVPGLDARAAVRWRQRVPGGAIWLNDEIGRRMADRLSWIKRAPARWLDWDPLWGGVDGHRLLSERYPQATGFFGGVHGQLAADRLQPQGGIPGLSGLWQRWTGRAAEAVLGERLPQPGVDMVWANMALHLTPRPQALLRHWLNCLAVDGFLMFSCLGPDSLRELRQVHADHGWPAPAHAFTDMHDWGDMLVAAGFAEPVMDMERLTLTYTRVEALVADLRLWGRNLNADRATGLRGRDWQARWLAALAQALPRDQQGAYTVTVEVVYGHALRGAPKVALEPTTAVPVDQMRAMLKQPRR